MEDVRWEKTRKRWSKKVRTNDENALKACIKLSRNQEIKIKTNLLY